jgi:hypothetical protein
MTAIQPLEGDRITLARQGSIKTVGVRTGRDFFFTQSYQVQALIGVSSLDSRAMQMVGNVTTLASRDLSPNLPKLRPAAHHPLLRFLRRAGR